MLELNDVAVELGPLGFAALEGELGDVYFSALPRSRRAA
jgi:hypothetical protein